MLCSAKKAAKGITPGKAGRRYWKNVGLGFKTPREAIEGELSADSMAGAGTQAGSMQGPCLRP